MLVSKVDSVVTPESSEYHDFDPDESGFVYENRPMTLRELLREIKDMGAYELNGGLRNVSVACGASFYSDYPWEDYRNGHSHSESLHIKLESDAEYRAFVRFVKLAKLV